MISLDNRTLLICQIVVSIIVSSFSFIPGTKHRKEKLKGFSLSNLFYILGFSLLLFQGVLPGFITVIVANLFIILFFALSSHIIMVVFGYNPDSLFNWIILVLNTLLFLIFYYILPNTYLRIIIISVLIIILFFRAIFYLLRLKENRKDYLSLFIIGSLLFYSSMLIFRIVLTTQLHLDIESIFSIDIATSIIFLATIAFHTGANLGVFIRLLHINENKLESKMNLIRDSYEDIKEINSLISSSKSQINSELYDKVNSFISNRFNVTSMIIYSVDYESDKLRMVSYRNLRLQVIDELKELDISDKHISGRAVLQDKPQFVTVEEYPDNEFKAILIEDGYYEIISYPIKSKKGIIGVFTLGVKKKPNHIKEDNDFFSLICDQIGTIFENVNLYNQLEDLATTDPLTKILNRRSFNDLFSHIYSKNRRDKTPISILMIDIDHFKSVNDTYGHDVGDLVLVKTANIIQSILREADIFARYGGEEFIVLMDGISEEQALSSAERIRESVMFSKFSIGPKEISVTLSVGISQSYPLDDDSSQIVSRADKALYIAKNSGRNNCVIFKK